MSDDEMWRSAALAQTMLNTILSRYGTPNFGMNGLQSHTLERKQTMLQFVVGDRVQTHSGLVIGTIVEAEETEISTLHGWYWVKIERDEQHPSLIGTVREYAGVALEPTQIRTECPSSEEADLSLFTEKELNGLRFIRWLIAHQQIEV